ncbi:strigolactone esterase D14-like [Syzygium oleosum]|uniref:strigolactone esterase D14-like n=1 Tax=Syzygium oleosum TaxID=219896 RepID=UPI0011D2A615|nr:strigolactone esterase D14-like [Syzygium oleosum]
MSESPCSSGGIFQALNGNVYGNGTWTLVLSHGFGADQTVWHHVVPFLACFFKVVVYDLAFVHPGVYGAAAGKYSDLGGYAEDLVRLLDGLKVKRSIYVGHSMSAMIGCLAAIRRPDLFEQLVLLSGSPRYLNAKGYTGGFDEPAINSILQSMRANYSGWIHDFAPTAIALNNTGALMEFEHSLGRIEPEIAVSVAKTVFLSDLRWALPKVPVPCSIIRSRKDIIVPASVSHYMKKKIGNGTSKVKILRTQGHFPMLTAYPLLLDALKGAI